MQLLPPILEIPVLLVEHNIEYSLSLQRFMLAKSIQEQIQLLERVCLYSKMGANILEASDTMCYTYH